MMEYSRSKIRLAGLTVVATLLSGCQLGSFTQGEGEVKSCNPGELGCFCRVGSLACDAPLLCIDDMCVDPNADGQGTSSQAPKGNDGPTNEEPLPTGEGESETGSSSQSPDSSQAPEPEPEQDCVVDEDCDDTNPCTKDLCIDSVCVNRNDQERLCDDGDPCTAGDRCVLGQCVGRDTRVLSESFAKGPQRWETMRGELDDVFAPVPGTSMWEIGKAKRSTCGRKSGYDTGEDPANDYSSGDDNMLAGVVIGGCHEKAGDWDVWDCLFSPPFETSFFDSEALFSYQRHLHAPGIRIRRRQRGVQHRIVVRDAQDRVQTIVSGYEGRVNDSDWVEVSRTFEQQVGPTSIGFCFRRGNKVRDFAGWSIDQVQVAQSGCLPEK